MARRLLFEQWFRDAQSTGTQTSAIQRCGIRHLAAKRPAAPQSNTPTGQRPNLVAVPLGMFFARMFRLVSYAGHSWLHCSQRKPTSVADPGTSRPEPSSRPSLSIKGSTPARLQSGQLRFTLKRCARSVAGLGSGRLSFSIHSAKE